jgi:TRAP-type C4-dicarboxylate transport system substrate-binding protein
MSFRLRLTTVLAAATAVLSLAGAAGAQTIELKLSHFLPPNHTFHKFALAWGEQLEKESGGKLRLQIYPATQLGGGANRQFDSARNGVVDIAISTHGATPGRYPMTELVSLPFAAPASGATSEAMSRRLTELSGKYLAQEHQGLRILFMAVTSPLKIHSIAPILKVDDLKGKKVRFQGIQLKNVIDAVGAVPVPVPPPETQDALSKGIVDSATFPHEGASSFDLGTVVKYSLEPGISSATFAVVMNPAKYESLPADLKALIDKTVGPAAAQTFGAAWDKAEIEGKASMTAKGVTQNTLPAVEVAKFKALVAPQVEIALSAIEAKGQPARAFYQEFLK